MNYNNLMKPLTVNGMTIRNRVMMTPMGTNYANPDGSMSAEHRHYYELRAKGGTGLIAVENVCVDYPLGSNGTSQLRLDHDRFIPHLYELTEVIHKWGGKAAVQINHAGAAALSSRIGCQPVSASNIPCKIGGEIPRSLTKEEIYELIKQYGMAAKRAKMSGFDAVEVHAGHSYLLNQFISPTTNKRIDEFGGNPENRCRFLKNVLQEIRKHIGNNYPIMLRISAEEFVPGGLSLEDTLEWLPFVNEYIDIYDVSAGLNDSMENMIDKGYHPDGWKSYLARAVREKFEKPVITSGNYRDPHVAEEVIERGDADIIGIGRGLIADPDWCNKVQAGEENEIRKCISCCIGCAGNRMGYNRPIRCTVNPAVQEGEKYKEKILLRQCNVVVIGAGPAGLEAACTAAEVGCTVTLIEKEDYIGGRANRISNIPEKKRLKDYLDYSEYRIKKLKNLKILLKTEATVELIKKLEPDIAVIGTGSRIITPPIPGLLENLRAGNIMTAEGVIDKILRKEFPDDFMKKMVVIIGGGATGLDMIEFFANRNANCTIVEMAPIIGSDIDPVSKAGINNLMRNKQVCQRPNTKLTEVKPNCFVTDGGKIFFDYGIICLGLQSYNTLSSELESSVKTIAVGDALCAPRQIIDGVREGRNVLAILETLGYIK